MTTAIQITSYYFCAAVELDDKNIVIFAAPILRYMTGWTDKKIANYCFRKQWKMNKYEFNTLA